jgi:hypothetical protein
MRKLNLFLFALLFANLTNAQTIILDINSGESYFDTLSGTYIKDMNNQFGRFTGTWKYQNGNEILIFKLEKVTKYYFSEYNTYVDFMKGNYSYSIDGGNTYIVNTIIQNLGKNDPSLNSMYSCGPHNQFINEFRFTDVIYQKSNCTAKFTFSNGLLNQLMLNLSNNGGGYILPAVEPNQNFSIPNNVILIKQ